jgi:Sulfotransferase domain
MRGSVVPTLSAVTAGLPGLGGLRDRCAPLSPRRARSTFARGVRVKTRQPSVGEATSPILVTGMHRSGTSWLGMTVTAGGGFVNIGEPLNVQNRQTILPSCVPLWYTHIHDANESDYLPYYEDAMAFKLHPLNDMRRMRFGSPRDPFRIGQRWASFLVGRLHSRRLLIKDPFAVFSIGWFVRRLGCQVVVVIRHPLAVIGSLKRNDFTFDFANLSRQASLMDGPLRPFRNDIDAALGASNDVVGSGALLWRIIYEVVAGDLGSTNVVMVRHEDLSREPVDEFARLFRKLDLRWTPDVRDAILASTNQQNPAELPSRKPFQTHVNSRANLTNWKHRLDDAEVERVLEITQPTVSRYYPEGLSLLGA